MKQSKEQSATVQVQLPDYVTLKQLEDVMGVENNNDLYYKIYVISVTTGLPISKINEFDISILPILYNDCVSLYSEVGPPIQAIIIDGDTYVLSLPYKKTIGEFGDLETRIQNGSVMEISSSFFQKYNGNLEGEWIELDGGIKVQEFSTDNTIDPSNLAKYDYSSLADPKIFKYIPYKYYRGTVDFIAGTGMNSTLGFQKSMDQQMLLSLQKEIHKTSESLVTSAILEKLTFFGSQKKTA